MINPQWLELPMSRTNFHGPKDVRAIEVRLYIENFTTNKTESFQMVVLTSTHNLCFEQKLEKKMYTPVNPSFTILKWGLREWKLYRYVFMMI